MEKLFDIEIKTIDLSLGFWKKCTYIVYETIDYTSSKI